MSEKGLCDVVVPCKEFDYNRLAEEWAVIEHVEANECTCYFFKFYESLSKCGFFYSGSLFEVIQSWESERNDFAELFQFKEDIFLDRLEFFVIFK